MNTYKIGIDLGTTNTVCYMFDRGLEAIPLDSGPSKYSLPSVIQYRNGTISVGRIAKQRLESDPDHCIKSSKRHMGENIVLKTIDGRSFTPVDAAAEILKTVKTKALEYFKDTETNARIEAVITVPAYFTSNQKADTYKAAEKAGITVLRLIDEPTAAAIASLYEEDNTPWDEKPDKDQRKVLILDIGGGTFDISLVEINNSGDKDIYDPIHIGGDTKLGGDDFDDKLYEFARQFINDNYFINMRTEGTSGLDHDTYSTMQGTLKRACEETKIELSDEEETEITIENFGGRNYRRIVDIPLSREDFEETAEDLFDQFEKLLKDFWKNNRSDLRGISNVIMVGGTSAIPRLQDITRKITGQKPEFNPDDASNNVAIGAALLASPDKSGVLVQCRTPYPFGIKGRLYTMDIFKEIIPAGTLCPANGERVFYTNRRNQRWMEIEIYRGEKDSDKLIPNGKYGEIRIPIPSWKESGYEILVHFEIDENNIIHVIAEDKIEKTKKEIEITNL